MLESDGQPLIYEGYQVPKNVIIEDPSRMVGEDNEPIPVVVQQNAEVNNSSKG